MAETSEDFQIRTVAGPGLTLSQGPAVNQYGRPGEPSDKSDMHGHLAVRVGETTTAVGLPVPSIRRE